jgi:hypothetical protein
MTPRVAEENRRARQVVRKESGDRCGDDEARGCHLGREDREARENDDTQTSE